MEHQKSDFVPVYNKHTRSGGIIRRIRTITRNFSSSSSSKFCLEPGRMKEERDTLCTVSQATVELAQNQRNNCWFRLKITSFSRFNKISDVLRCNVPNSRSKQKFKSFSTKKVYRSVCRTVMILKLLLLFINQRFPQLGSTQLIVFIAFDNTTFFLAMWLFLTVKVHACNFELATFCEVAVAYSGQWLRLELSSSLFKRQADPPARSHGSARDSGTSRGCPNRSINTDTTSGNAPSVSSNLTSYFCYVKRKKAREPTKPLGKSDYFYLKYFYYKAFYTPAG